MSEEAKKNGKKIKPSMDILPSAVSKMTSSPIFKERLGETNLCLRKKISCPFSSLISPTPLELS